MRKDKRHPGLTAEVISATGCYVNIGGQSGVLICAHDVQAILDYSCPEAQGIIVEARNSNRYIPVITDSSRIKSVIVTTNLNVYPSSFRMETVAARLQNALNT
ncbi:extracellular matrix/biofilm biosynthesis regulator RemA family protein [Ileibacterium valens]|uniref:extracellular matrix/biofilm biosynthesis regulator RemA family protein n=1 Tax=Ileibacterium valens TaxID=1862668 RepID=UPI002570D5DC|nr:extracellular matrix/biofilm biosynthesis regulator RemA family protein [Ileibacterium valens]